ncbi:MULTISPECIES: hypothetical protein [Burkholderiaceae]|uniref:Transmembrane protein n=1 Tax=Burkholderia cepacia TaxID=292 RepID=A0A8I1AGA7_BURCE|nr:MULTISPECIES: hypothetical protein [Burkholderiaceae]MBH9681713.1 hypothetical protein [Burkholderia cepacia]MBH9696118.1 hypothetical protein [Burkholderia cepacia]MBH9712319.1 hypothetical protein [Burkholderia cepacia]MBH9732806.1 hypothetical protein [Burkholderia cepacia]MBX4002684.1 hypothetical protein [Ralstonia pickettii]
MDNLQQHYRQSRIMVSWASFRSLPGWVQFWVGCILVPVNAASFAMLDTGSGRAIAAAALLVVATNVPIMLWARGMTKLMAVPHLFIWGPLQWFLLSKIRQFSDADAMPPLELIYVTAVLLVNGISLAFDALDSWRWLKGDRAVPGMRV